jgi:DNA-binding MarR family transcriptional regulator
VNATDLSVRVHHVLRMLALQKRAAQTPSRDGTGATWAQDSLLRTLVAHGRIRVFDLARIEEVSRPTMSIAVQRLRKRGLVTVTRDAVDQRGRWVEITGAGLTAHRRSIESGCAALAGPLHLLSSQDRQSLATVIPILNRLADSYTDTSRSESAAKAAADPINDSGGNHRCPCRSGR